MLASRAERGHPRASAIAVARGWSPISVLVFRVLILLFMYLLCRLLFYFFNSGLFPGVTARDMAVMELGGLRFDLSAILYVNLLYCIMQIIPFRFRYKKTYQRVADGVFYFTNSIALALNCIDLIYYRFTLRRTTAIVFGEFRGTQNHLQLAYHFLTGYYYIFLLWIALIALMVWLVRRIRVTNQIPPANLRHYSFHGLGFLALPLLIVLGIRSGLGPKQDFPLAPSDAGQYARHPNDIAIVQNTPFCMLLSLDKKLFTPQHYFDEKELEMVYSPVHRPQATEPFNPRNIVLIIVESLGRETLGCMNKQLDNGRYSGYTPFLDSLAGASLIFPNAYANGRMSIEGSPSVIASVPSLQESFTFTPYYSNKLQTLPGLLAAKGYSSMSAHGAPNGSLGLNAFAVAAGFQRYLGKDEYNHDADYDGVWGIWDHQFLPFFARSCSELNTPFCASVFTVSSHHPYRIPAELADQFPAGTMDIHRSIRYADYSLREFFREAARQPWYANTVFVITADHSCAAYHDEYKTTVGAFAAPIIFFTPDHSLTGVNSRVAQQIDIMPSLLSYLRFDQPYFAFGKNLFDSTADPIAVSYIGNTFQLIWDNWVIQHNTSETVALFDLAADPLQKNNLAGRRPEVQARMEKKVKAVIQQYNNRMIENRMTVSADYPAGG